MSSKVIKLIIVTDDDTAGMITDYTMLTPKQRDNIDINIKFEFTDKNSIEHELYFVHAEEV